MNAMDQTIWKYPLTKEDLTKAQHIYMPQGARIIAIQGQHNTLVLWAIVNSDNPPEMRTFFVIPTGGVVPRGYHYRGTVQFGEGSYVVHVFEKANTK